MREKRNRKLSGNWPSFQSLTKTLKCVSFDFRRNPKNAGDIQMFREWNFSAKSFSLSTTEILGHQKIFYIYMHSVSTCYHFWHIDFISNRIRSRWRKEPILLLLVGAVVDIVIVIVMLLFNIHAGQKWRTKWASICPKSEQQLSTDGNNNTAHQKRERGKERDKHVDQVQCTYVCVL